MSNHSQIKAIVVERDGREIEFRVGGIYTSNYGGKVRVILVGFMFTNTAEPSVIYRDTRSYLATVPISWLAELSPLEQLAEQSK